MVGDCHLIGDQRWAGAWGIDADFSARTACSIMCICTSDVQVCWSLLARDDGVESREWKDRKWEFDQHGNAFSAQQLISNKTCAYSD